MIAKQDQARTANPRLFITCRCGAKWSGDRLCHCAGCHFTFSTIGTFDKHRRTGECRNPEDVKLVARTKKAGRYKYVVWGYAGTWNPREEA